MRVAKNSLFKVVLLQEDADVFERMRTGHQQQHLSGMEGYPDVTPPKITSSSPSKRATDDSLGSWIIYLSIVH